MVKTQVQDTSVSHEKAEHSQVKLDYTIKMKTGSYMPAMAKRWQYDSDFTQKILNLSLAPLTLAIDNINIRPEK